MRGVDALTGLPEYRNGGLLLDTGVLRLREPDAAQQVWQPGDEIIVEWRALTVALLDELAARGARASCGCRRAALPLACVLEGGTWAAGRELAQRTAQRPAAAAGRERRHGVLRPSTLASRSRRTMSNVHLIDHPLVQHKLTLMRKKEASTNSFRRLLNELAMLMAYEVTRDMPMQDIEIETPLETMTAKVIDGKKLVFVSILRAGTGILDGMLNVVPGARVGHIGLYRDPKTLVAVEYYFKMPRRHGTSAT